MGRSTTAAAVTAILLVCIMAFGATAFTSAEVKREAEIDVVTDSGGPLSFAEGGTGITTTTSSGEIAIDTGALAGASGINKDAKYQYGQPSADDVSSSSLAANDYVFSMTNEDVIEHSINLTYSPDNVSVGADNVRIEIYRMGDGGTTSGVLTTVQADNSTVSFTAAADTTYHAVVVLNTGVNGAPDIPESDVLSGTLTVEV